MTDVWSSYTTVRSHSRPRLIWSSFGEAGTGKTTFALQGPAPVVVQSLDFGLEGVADEFRRDKQIIEIEYNWNPTNDMTQEAAVEIRDTFVADYRYALKHARTVVWDKETQVWELFRFAELGLGDAHPSAYAPLKQRYRALINEAKATDVNFGLIQGMRSPWDVGPRGLQKSDRRLRRGMDEIEELVHLNIEHYVETVPTEQPPYRFMLRTGKMRGPGARTLQYQEMPALTFAEFGQLLFPASAESDWV